MYSKLISVLVLVLVEVLSVEESNGGDYNVASTSQRPFQNQVFDKSLTKLEEILQCYTKAAESSHRLEAIELQNKQMQKMLENISSVLTNLQTKVTANSDKLEVIEKKLLNVDFVVTNKSTQSYNSFPKDCYEVKKRGANLSKIYHIHPARSAEAIATFCDMETKGGGWTYVLNRVDGSQNFDLNWNDYKYGFGNTAQDFWIGLEPLHQLTSSEVNELLIELMDKDQKEVYAHYEIFSIGDESEGYALKNVTGYSGDAGDSFSDHIGMKFSTKDKDQDVSAANCAQIRGGGWWYDDCYWSKLTGKYLRGNLSVASYGKGIHWGKFHGFDYGLKKARMMVRPKDDS